MSHHLVPCDAVGCADGFIGDEPCGKCGGTGRILIAEAKSHAIEWAVALIALIAALAVAALLGGMPWTN